MLASLHIENIAVIKCVDIDFSAGFTALTGETGAGKSILIDSINFLLGARSSRDILRSGEERALVSAVFYDFSSEDTAELLKLEIEPDEDGNLLISRTMNAEGRTQSRINGRPVNSYTLREIAPRLLNIHGQNDSLQLLNTENHVLLLDAYAQNECLKSAFLECFARFQTSARELDALIADDTEKAKRMADLIKDIQLLESAKIVPGEKTKLLTQRTLLQNAEKISRQTSFVYRALKGAEKANAAYILERCASALSQIADAVPDAEPLAARLRDMKYEAEDIAETVFDFTGGLDEDPGARLDRIETRLDRIEKLERRFGVEEAGLAALLIQKQKEYADYSSIEETLADAKAQCALDEKAAATAAEALTDSRREAAGKLIPLIRRELEFLDMEKVTFEIAIDHGKAMTATGADTVEFLISVNPGEPPKSISKIASGGELARIMLAIKSVFANAFSLKTAIYDEVDTGVSGKTARKIGIRLKQSAHSTQTICVTHSAQIASLADHHMLIRKNSEAGRAETTVEPLNYDARVQEIARILGGVTVSENMLISARELIDEGKNY